MALVQFIDGYVGAALLDLEHVMSSERPDDQPELDSAAFSRRMLADETLETIEAECTQFYTANKTDWSGCSDATAGYCFWHNRNGAGVGFWDEDRITDPAKRDELSAASHTYGTADWYIGDDDMIYQFESQLAKGQVSL